LHVALAEQRNRDERRLQVRGELGVLVLDLEGDGNLALVVRDLDVRDAADVYSQHPHGVAGEDLHGAVEVSRHVALVVAGIGEGES
jgi:hypothetical protein